MPIWKRLVPLRAKLWARGKATKLLGLPWNPHGVPISLMRRIPQGSPITLIDVGASKGDFTASMEEYCGIRKALLIEPLPERIAQCRARFVADRFTFVGAAATDHEGILEMDVLNWDYSSSIL